MAPGTDEGGAGGRSCAAAKFANVPGSIVCPGEALRKVFAKRAINPGSITEGASPPHWGAGGVVTGALAAAWRGSGIFIIVTNLHILEHAERILGEDRG